MSGAIKKLEIILETENPEISAYLDGWLHGIHDVGCIRAEKTLEYKNKHKWEVEIMELRFNYAAMTPREIADDLTTHLSYVGFIIRDPEKWEKVKRQMSQFRVEVYEKKPEPARLVQLSALHQTLKMWDFF